MSLSVKQVYPVRLITSEEDGAEDEDEQVSSRANCLRSDRILTGSGQRLDTLSTLSSDPESLQAARTRGVRGVGGGRGAALFVLQDKQRANPLA